MLPNNITYMLSSEAYHSPKHFWTKNNFSTFIQTEQKTKSILSKELPEIY